MDLSELTSPFILSNSLERPCMVGVVLLLLIVEVCDDEVEVLAVAICFGCVVMVGATFVTGGLNGVEDCCVADRVKIC